MSPSLPSVKPRKIVKILKKLSFVEQRQKGSHLHLKSSKNPSKRVTIPVHNKDLKQGALRSIIRQAGLTENEFLDLL